MVISESDLKKYLDKQVSLYNRIEFIQDDPIQIPHRYFNKEDIEIAGFLTSTIAWGQRKSIINNANQLMNLMYNSPYEFISNHIDKVDEKLLKTFVHRTFNGEDSLYFITSLSNIYKNHGGLEQVFKTGFEQTGNIYGSLIHFRQIFFEISHPNRTTKHISNVSKNSSAKRLNMFLRWMVRKDDNGIDFGIWKTIPISALMLPLDIHTGNVGRLLGLLNRTQNDWKAVEEVTANLRKLDPFDPIKYDFALFGTGAYEWKNLIKSRI